MCAFLRAPLSGLGKRGTTHDFFRSPKKKKNNKHTAYGPKPDHPGPTFFFLSFSHPFAPAPPSPHPLTPPTPRPLLASPGRCLRFSGVSSALARRSLMSRTSHACGSSPGSSGNTKRLLVKKGTRKTAKRKGEVSLAMCIIHMYIYIYFLVCIYRVWDAAQACKFQ